MENQIQTTAIIHPIKALILDDEIDACRNLEILIKRYWGSVIEIIGITQSTLEAETIINKMDPQVIFIDIEMPQENAFHFLDRIKRKTFEIIFVTAYDEYALRALKLNAIDYILKPISLDELGDAVKKLQEKMLLRQLSSSIFSDHNYAGLAEQINSKKNIETLALRSKTELIVLEFNEILYIEAVGAYANFHYLKDKKLCQITMSHSISEYEDLLPPSVFYRIHKSYLLNSNRIKKVILEGQNYVEVYENIILPISRRRQQSFVAFLKSKT